MNRLLSTIVLLFFTSLAFGQENVDKTLIWRISGGELQGKSYIVATVPLQDSVFYQYPDKLWNYLEKTDVFISFDTKSESNSITKYREQQFSQFNKDYSILPAAYMQTQATQQLKPVVELDKTYSYQNDFKPTTTINTSGTSAQVVIDSFLSGDLAGLTTLRSNLDLNEATLMQLQDKNNYQILNDLINQMKLQPVFFPVDAVYLTGQNGIINLLKARGFQVKPMQENFYKKNAKVIAARNEAFPPIQSTASLPSNNTETTNSSETVAVSAPTSNTTPVTLDLPIGVINLTQWSAYSLKDSLVIYEAPSRLKAPTDLAETFTFKSNDLIYSIEFQPPFTDLKQAVQRLIISNGGQLTYENKFNRNGINGLEVELMYAENRLSKHYLMNGPEQGIIISVSGEVPTIFSVEADRFLQSIALKTPSTMFTSADGISPEAATSLPDEGALMWQNSRIKEMNVFVPIPLTDVSTTLKNGQKLTASVLPRGEVDQNVYLFASTPKDSFDNFKLFNEAINIAAADTRSVITNREVMPSGKPYFAEYELKDAVENYYRVLYWYDKKDFYQLVIRGDKKSIDNTISKQIIQSIQLTSLPQINVIN